MDKRTMPFREAVLILWVYFPFRALLACVTVAAEPMINIPRAGMAVPPPSAPPPFPIPGASGRTSTTITTDDNGIVFLPHPTVTHPSVCMP